MPHCTPKQSISPRIISFNVSLRSYMLDVVAVFTVWRARFPIRHAAAQTDQGWLRSKPLLTGVGEMP
jgi:hypothetical protein